MEPKRLGLRIGPELPEPAIGKESRWEIMRIWEVGDGDSCWLEFVFCPREYADEDGDNYRFKEAEAWADRLTNAAKRIAEGISVNSGADRGEVLGHLSRCIQFNLMGEGDASPGVEQ